MIEHGSADRGYKPPIEALKILELAQAQLSELSETGKTLEPGQEIVLKEVKSQIEKGVDEEELQELDGIIVLGASMRYRKFRGWKFSNLIPSDPYPLVGGHFRITAAKRLNKLGFNGHFLVAGGLQKNDSSGKEESKAEALAQAIKKKAPNADVIAIGTADNGYTTGNIIDVISFLEEQKQGHEDDSLQDKPIKRYGILTSGWHLPRAMILFSSEEYFKQHGIELFPINADNPHQGNLLHRIKVKRFLSNSKMPDRIKSEAQGVVNALSGDYVPVPKY